MNERHAVLIRLVATAVGLVFVGGCSTFGDDNVVARIGEHELSESEFAERAAAAADPKATSLTGDSARLLITNWIYLTVARDTGLLHQYDLGPAVSGFACLNAFLAPDIETANEAIAALTDGADHATIAATIDPGNAEVVALGCNTASEYGLEATSQLGSMTAIDPHHVVVLGDATYVVSLQSESQIDANQFMTAAFAIDPEATSAVVDQVRAAAIYVDPRFGFFNVETGDVVALG